MLSFELRLIHNFNLIEGNYKRLSFVRFVEAVSVVGWIWIHLITTYSYSYVLLAWSWRLINENKVTILLTRGFETIYITIWWCVSYVRINQERFWVQEDLKAFLIFLCRCYWAGPKIYLSIILKGSEGKVDILIIFIVDFQSKWASIYIIINLLSLLDIVIRISNLTMKNLVTCLIRLVKVSVLVLQYLQTLIKFILPFLYDEC